MSEREAVDKAAGQCDGRRDKAAGGEDQSNKEYVLGHVDLAGPFVQPYVAIAGGRGERGLPRLPSGEDGCLLRGQLDGDLRRREQRVVNQAVMHGAHHAFPLLFGERDGRCDTDFEVAQPRGLLELFGGH